MKEFIVEKEKNNINLIKYIYYKFPNLKYSVLQKALRNKDIKVNNKGIKSDIILNSGDIIKIYIQDELLFNLPTKLSVIYIDDNIIVFFKPQGILSNNEDPSSVFEKTFEDLVKQTYPEAKICHRLDRNTSGLIIFARNDTSYSEILKAFKNNLITKNYTAFVAGSKFSKHNDRLEKYILKDEKTGFSKIYNTKVKNSKKIITEYNVIDTNNKLDYAILNVRIHTGKTHQIRAQLANISHPIIGDQKYGKNEINKKYKRYKQLLTASCYLFNFDNTSPLYYLNKTKIELDDKYMPSLGSD